VKRLAISLVLVAIGIVTAGCGERAEPVGAIPQSYPVTVEGAGESPLAVRKPPERIVALDAGSAELISALGAGSKLVGAPAGVSVSGKTRPEVVVKASGQIDVDEAVTLQPDLVVATPQTDRVDVAQVVQRSGAALYLQPSRTIDDVRHATIELGFLLGRPVAARALNSKLKSQVAQILTRLEGVAPVTVFVDTGLFVTISDTSILGDLIREAHGRNVASDPGLGPVSPEELAAANPNVYLATSDSHVTLQSLRRNPKTQNLAAVRRGRVVILNADLVMRAGPNVGNAFEEVAAALHPDAFQ
jgi:iron complex transport system substrate-binding protein